MRHASTAGKACLAPTMCASRMHPKSTSSCFALRAPQPYIYQRFTVVGVHEHPQGVFLLRCPKFVARIRSPNFDRCHSLLLAVSAAGGARNRPRIRSARTSLTAAQPRPPVGGLAMTKTIVFVLSSKVRCCHSEERKRRRILARAHRALQQLHSNKILRCAQNDRTDHQIERDIML